MHSDWLDQHIISVTAVLFFVTAVGTPWVVNRTVSLHRRRSHNDVLVAGSGIVGVVNAVLLAFIVFAAWTNYDRAQDAVSRESDAANAVARDLDDPDFKIGSAFTHDSIVLPIESYVTNVIEHDWPAMEAGLVPNATDSTRPTFPGMQPSSRALRIAYRNALKSLDEPNLLPSRRLVFEETVRRLNVLYEARRDRIGFAMHGSLSDIVWVVVLIGGLLTVAVCALYGFEDRLLHYLTTILVALCLAMVFYLIMSLDTPFSGAARISSEAFERVQHGIQAREAREARERESAKVPATK